jgi:hypothetical protein
MPFLRLAPVLALALVLGVLSACGPGLDPTGPASDAAIADAMATSATMPEG